MPHPAQRRRRADHSRWLAGAPDAGREGPSPEHHPGGDLGDWSAGDIAYYLESGFTPDFDTVGGRWSRCRENMAMLPADRAAIAAYLKAL